MTSTVGTLTSATAVPTSFNAYTSTTYNFTIVPANAIPIGGVILITIPSEITISNPTFTANSCSSTRRNLRNKDFMRELASTGLESTFYCNATPTTITVIDGFQSSNFSAGGTISFDIDGILNPRSLQPSSTFTVNTQTSDGFQINQLTSGITVTMTSVSQFNLVSLSSTSLVNSASNNITFTINSPSILIDGDILSITFPSQVTLPSSFTCVGVTNLASSLTCSLSGTVLNITLNFSSSNLTAGTSFIFTLQSITNPSSTQSTDTFSFSVSSSGGFLINDYSTDVKLTTTTPSTITSASLTQSSLDANATNDVTFNITLINNVAAGGTLSLIYPSQITVTAATLSAELVSPTAIASLTSSLTSSSRRIDITDMFPSGATAGDTYQFIIKNLRNSEFADQTSSFQITTYTDSTRTYSIDRVNSGLTMSAN